MDVVGQDGDRIGSCPLQHIDTTASISGYVARVTVKQQFRNPYHKKIKATYKFPLSNNAAVDQMRIKIGDRIIAGSIKKKVDARRLYEEACTKGYVAALVEQERTNVFTQSIANIEPGKSIDVTLEYSELVYFDKGKYSFVFPTVVGPRFNPGDSHEGLCGLPARISDVGSPPVATGSTGTTFSIRVNLNAGLPMNQLNCQLHDSYVQRLDASHAVVSLRTAGTIPNRDFVLSWDVAGDNIRGGYLAHGEKGHGYASLMFVPPRRVKTDAVAPRELIFLIDCSGSQAGLPLEKAKETLKYIVDRLNPRDTFQIIAFSNYLNMLANKPLDATPLRQQQAKEFIDRLSADGGTWMAPAVEAACKMPADKHRLRIVTFMTDGYVGNDYEVIGLIKSLRKTSRWFSFGTGDSVNRCLIDGIAREGGGEAEYVYLNSPGEEVARRFYERISSPVLTDAKLEFEGLAMQQVYPRDPVDLWAEKPLYFQARYARAGRGHAILTGYVQGRPYRQSVDLVLPETEPGNEAVPQLWARAKIDDLMSQDWMGAQTGNMATGLREEIVATALGHHLLSQFTSFVAIDKYALTKGDPESVDVPVDNPHGTVMQKAGILVALRGTSGMARSAGPVLGMVCGGALLTGLVFEHARGQLSNSVSQSFSTVVSQLNQLNCYPGAGYGGAASPLCGVGSSAPPLYATGLSAQPSSHNACPAARVAPAPVRLQSTRPVQSMAKTATLAVKAGVPTTAPTEDWTRTARDGLVAGVEVLAALLGAFWVLTMLIDFRNGQAVAPYFWFCMVIYLVASLLPMLLA